MAIFVGTSRGSLVTLSMRQRDEAFARVLKNGTLLHVFSSVAAAKQVAASLTKDMRREDVYAFPIVVPDYYRVSCGCVFSCDTGQFQGTVFDFVHPSLLITGELPAVVEKLRKSVDDIRLSPREPCIDTHCLRIAKSPLPADWAYSWVVWYPAVGMFEGSLTCVTTELVSPLYHEWSRQVLPFSTWGDADAYVRQLPVGVNDVDGYAVARVGKLAMQQSPPAQLWLTTPPAPPCDKFDRVLVVDRSVR